MGRENVMRFHCGSALIPQLHLKPGTQLNLLRKLPAQLRPGAFGAVHILWKTQYNLAHIICLNQIANFVDRLLFVMAVYYACASHNAAQQVRDCDASSGITVINSHYSHWNTSFRFFFTYYSLKKQKNKEKNC